MHHRAHGRRVTVRSEVCMLGTPGLSCRLFLRLAPRSLAPELAPFPLASLATPLGAADGPSATDSTKDHASRGLYDRRGLVKLPCCSSHALLGWDTAQSLKHRQEQTPVSTGYKPAPSSTSCLRLPTVGLHGKLQLSSQPFVGKRVRPSCHCACTCPTPSERGT